MARIHAFEFEDQTWLPGVVREYITDFLTHLGGWSPIPYQPFVERFADALSRTGDERVVDLCSGGGGPALVIVRSLEERLGRRLGVVLTDLYPTSRRPQARAIRPTWVEREARPVDARRVPPDLSGFRLVCNGFHHLRPRDARACLLDAVEQGRGVAVLELTRRSALTMLQVALGTATLLAVSPFIKPFRWTRLLLTYVVPLIPVCTLWDGIVSCLRVYDPEELAAMVRELPERGYDWEYGLLPVPRLGTTLTYLIGTPSPPSGAPATSRPDPARE
jgi:hypothetical protein